jgi:putative DNA primase/helicase
VSVEIEIAEVMRSCGLMPPRYITFDGKIHRLGKNKSSWCVFFDGHVKAGAFGDWKTGVNEKYVEARLDITPKDRQRIAQQMREAAAQRERELQVSHQQAANTRSLIWGSAEESGTNDYLTSKGLSSPISDYGLRQGKGSFGTYTPFGDNEVSLIVPSVDVDGTLHSLQFIAPDGQKRFYPCGKLKGHFYAIGLFDIPVKVLITEGIATALTLYEDTGFPVIAAFNCGNLAPVAEAIRWKYADVDILICGDDDHTTDGNPGRTKAIEAAARCGGDWVLPDFTGLPRGPKDTDFNDLRQLQRCAA